MNAKTPIRLQIYEEALHPPLRDQYDVRDLCEKLEPPINSAGSYHNVLARPSVYMYTFTKTEPASQAKLSDFRGKRLSLKSDEILPPSQAVTQIRFNLKAFRLYDKDYVVGVLKCSKQLTNLLEKKEPPPPPLVAEMIHYTRELEIFTGEEKVNEQQEVAINAKFANLLQTSIFPVNEFEVNSFSKETSLKICRYAISRQDITIYNVKKYIQKGSVRAAVLVSPDGDEEMETDETEDEFTITGGTLESKLSLQTEHKDLGQLVAEMEKLGADLCIKGIQAGNVLIQKIIIFGVLLNIEGGVAKPASLEICFNEGATLKVGLDYIDISECLYRVRNKLS